MNQPCQICADKTATYFTDNGRYCGDCVPKRSTVPPTITELRPQPERWQDRMTALELRIERLEKLIAERTADS